MTVASVEPLLDALRIQLERMGQAPGEGDSRRLFHGRGGCYPGFEYLVVDYFAPVALVTLFRQSELETEILGAVQALAAEAGIAFVAVQRRYLPGAPLSWLTEACGETLYARRGPLRFNLELGYQNVGFFLDIEPGRQWLEARVRERMSVNGRCRVLNLFAFTCAFSVIASREGASVLNVDMNGGVLSRGRENHRLNGLAGDDVRYMALDILRSFGRINRAGPFDIAVVDPPTHQKGSFEAERHYSKLIRRLPESLAEDAEVLLCLNSPGHSEAWLRELVAQSSDQFEVVARLPQSADFPDISGDSALKMLHLRRRPSPA